MSGRRRRVRIEPRIWFGLALLAALSVSIAGTTWLLFRGRVNLDPARMQRSPQPQPSRQDAAQPTPLQRDRREIPLTATSDSADLPWTSPTCGRPLDIAGLLGGVQLIVRLRMSELWRDQEFQRTWKLWAAATGAARRESEQPWGLQFGDIDQLTLLVAPDREQSVDWAAHVVLSPSVSLPATWVSASASDDRGSAPTLVEYEITAAQEGTVGRSACRVISAPGARQLELLITRWGRIAREPLDEKPALLFRHDLEQLHALSDEARHITVITTTSFVTSHPVWFRSLPGYSALTRTILRGTTANLLSAHFMQHELYLELISATPLEQQQQMPDRYREWVSSWCVAQPSATAGWPEAIRSSPFGRRWPEMAEFVRSQMRYGHVADLTIVNASLPVHASHNLVCGILLSETQHLPRHARLPERPSGFSWPSLLASRITYRFEQRSLDHALAGLEALVRDAVPAAEQLRLVIDGPSLASAGMTRNQQIRNFNVNDMPLAGVLSKLAELAQPGTPAEEASRLVWAYDANLQGGYELTLTTAETPRSNANLTVVAPNR